MYVRRTYVVETYELGGEATASLKASPGDAARQHAGDDEEEEEEEEEEDVVVVAAAAAAAAKWLLVR